MQYSIDKIKLEFRFIKTSLVREFLRKLEMSDYSSYYESKKVTSCKHNFVFGEGDGTIYLGIIPNWRKEDVNDKNIVLEYNPNKINPFIYEDFEWLRRIHKCCINIMSFDVAVDIPIDYGLVRMLKRDVREYQCEIGHRSVETRYLGSLGHNHIKLYNKAKEQKQDIEWTRFEITNKEIKSLDCNSKDFEKSFKIPTLYCVQEQIDICFEQLNDITRIVLESIIRDVNVLNTIKRYETRKKYEKLLSQFLKSIDISIDEMYRAFRRYCDDFVCDTKDLKELIDVSDFPCVGK